MTTIEGLPDEVAQSPADRSESKQPGSTARFDADVAIIGLGYVGLPTALAFHAAGRRVVGIDVNTDRLIGIRSGAVDLIESDRARLDLAMDDDNLSLSTDPSVMATARAVIVCVPTPIDSHLVPDLRLLRVACRSMVRHAVPGQLLVMTSTAYVGSTYDLLVTPLAERGLAAGRDVFVAFSPERINPGNEDHAHEDVPRVVGGATPECLRRAEESLSAYARALHRVSALEVAEMSKLLENTYRAVNIALINEFADISRDLQVDVMEVIRAASTKPFGYMPFTPGPGVGGHCIPCDPHYLLWQARQRHLETPVIDRAMASIAARPRRVVDRSREVLSRAGTALSGADILIFGVAYKANVADMRESPALEIIARLRTEGANVAYHDPFVSEIRLADGATFYSDPDPDPGAADLIIALTPHGSIEPRLVRSGRLILDATYRLGGGPNLVPL